MIGAGRRPAAAHAAAPGHVAQTVRVLLAALALGAPVVALSARGVPRGAVSATPRGVPRGAVPETSTTVSAPATGIAVAVSPSGAYTITSRAPAWTFGGNIGHALTRIALTSGRDGIGAYKDVAFQYRVGAARRGAIRVYAARPVVLFRVTYLERSANTEPFPTLTTYPRGLSYLSYSGNFGHYRFDPGGLGGASDSPRLLFDKRADAFMFSPASNAMVAATTVAGTPRTGGVALSSGITTTIRMLPAGLTQTTMLAVGRGINATFDTWGRAMTGLQGKARPSNDADVGLTYVGYWTDNAAAYYYTWEDSHRYRVRDPRDYTDTLLAVRDAFKRLGLPLGYMQLDSWWYPKGPTADWGISGVIDHRGAYLYRAAPAVFPQGLRAFQRRLGLPLVTHARWIDPSSPYRREFKMSNTVSVDPRFWNDTIGYLRAAGVSTYEQDWLGDPTGAVAANTIRDQNAFMDGMAAAMLKAGLSMQYCMPSARHYLQSARYGNVYTMRVSEDGFKDGLAPNGAVDDKWTPFLYDARLAGTLGVWPFTDAVRSDSRPNLLLATLSGGMVGLADRLGDLEKNRARDRANLSRVARMDGVIVKPDTPIAPIDQTYLADAAGARRPMVAAAYSDHGGGMRAAYVFAYSRPRPDVPSTASFTPASLGFYARGRVYVYDYAAHRGAVQDARQQVVMRTQPYQGAYDIVAPVGQSGIALLGDIGKFASLGTQRVRLLRDDGRAVHTTIAFARGEGPVTLSGYAATAPSVAATYGAARIRYDARTRLFAAIVAPGPNGTSATLSITRRPV